ncbi:MAG: hypothetical protein GC208_09535 [Alphaproteobacteria bacterium]|nr:hypothetical protein [Alphaproteobacteria bacterium]
MTDETIIEGGEIAEAIATETGEFDSVELQELADMDATVSEKPAEPNTMSFHVQMRGYTLGSLETVIIEAAAKQIRSAMPRDTEQRVQDTAIEMANAAIAAKLGPITGELFDQPIVSSRWEKKEPMTLREYIGLVGKDFLTTRVKRDGTPSTSRYDQSEPRINWIIADVLEKRFKDEITAAFVELKNHVRVQLDSTLNAVIDAERKRLAEALGFDLKKSR